MNKNQKKKRKIKRRRQLYSEEFHGNRLRRIMDYQISQAFSDPSERLVYIDALIKKMGEI